MVCFYLKLGRIVGTTCFSRCGQVCLSAAYLCTFLWILYSKLKIRFKKKSLHQFKSDSNFSRFLKNDQFQVKKNKIKNKSFLNESKPPKNFQKKFKQRLLYWNNILATNIYILTAFTWKGIFKQFFLNFFLTVIDQIFIY